MFTKTLHFSVRDLVSVSECSICGVIVWSSRGEQFSSPSLGATSVWMWGGDSGDSSSPIGIVGILSSSSLSSTRLNGNDPIQMLSTLCFRPGLCNSLRILVLQAAVFESTQQL